MVISIRFHYMICVNNMNAAQKPMRFFYLKLHHLNWQDMYYHVQLTSFLQISFQFEWRKKIAIFQPSLRFCFHIYYITSQTKIKFLVYQSHKCHKIDSSHFFTPPHERRKKKENQRIENREYCNKIFFCL